MAKDLFSKIEREMEELRRELDAIENCRDSDIHKMLCISNLSRSEFTGGVIDFDREEMQEFLSYCIPSPLLSKTLKNGLRKYDSMPLDGKIEILGRVYEELMRLPEYNPENK